MLLPATIELNVFQVKEIICDCLARLGIKGVNHQNIHFTIKKIEKGTQIESWETYALQGVVIDNVKIGKEDI